MRYRVGDQERHATAGEALLTLKGIPHTYRLLVVAPGFTVTMMEQMEFAAPERVARFGAALRQADLPD